MLDEALIRIDMTGPWDWHNNIFEATVNKSSGVGGFTGQAPPNLINGALYAGSSADPNLYFYGGTTSYWNTSFPGWRQPSSQEYSLWSYDETATSQWNQYDILDASPHRPSRGFSAEAPDQGLAFYLNGHIDNGSSTSTTEMGNGKSVALTGMIVLDTATQTAKNISTAAMSGGSPRTGGGMAYIPSYGAHGILVAVAGISRSAEQATENSWTTFDDFISLDEVDIYDINGYYDDYSGWYKQRTTGAIPGPRTDSCVTVASTADGSSHSIHIYGGRGPGNITYDDVFVLSLPTFTWVQVWFDGQSPRYGHTCHIIGDQMLTVGGLVKSSACDWEDKGVAIFNATEVNWTSAYTPDAPAYVLPHSVASKVEE